MIYAGWYRNGFRNGNYLEINAKDMSVHNAGWYVHDRRLGVMRDDTKWKKFGIEHIFNVQQEKVEKMLATQIPVDIKVHG